MLLFLLFLLFLFLLFRFRLWGRRHCWSRCWGRIAWCGRWHRIGANTRHTLVVMLRLLVTIMARHATGGPCVTAATTLLPSGITIPSWRILRWIWRWCHSWRLLTLREHSDVRTIPEFLCELPACRSATLTVTAGGAFHASGAPLVGSPSAGRHLAEIREVKAVVEARVAGGPIPLKRAVGAPQARRDLVPHPVRLCVRRSVWRLAVIPIRPCCLCVGTAWREIPAMRLIWVQRLTVGIGIVWRAVSPRRRPLQDPVVQTSLPLGWRCDRVVRDAFIANPKLVVTLVVCGHADFELHDISCSVRAPDRIRIHVRLVGPRLRRILALHGIATEAVRLRCVDGRPSSLDTPASGRYGRWTACLQTMRAVLLLVDERNQIPRRWIREVGVARHLRGAKRCR